MQQRMYCAMAGTDRERLLKQIAQHSGHVYVDERDDPSRLPFAALGLVTIDDIDLFKDTADIGIYLVCERIIKPGRASVYGLFPMLRHPDLSHAAADAHWRDVHAPLALKHHAYMTQYSQLSVVATLRGTPLDGFALCGFNNLEDLKYRFFSEPDSQAVIEADVASFADTVNAPRRLIATPYRHE